MRLGVVVFFRKSPNPSRRQGVNLYSHVLNDSFVSPNYFWSQSLHGTQYTAPTAPHNIPHLDVQKGGQDSWLKCWHRFYNIQQLSEDLIIHYLVGWFCNRLYSVSVSIIV